MREKNILPRYLKIHSISSKMDEMFSYLNCSKLGNMFDIGEKMRDLEKTYVENIYMEMHQDDGLDN